MYLNRPNISALYFTIAIIIPCTWYGKIICLSNRHFYCFSKSLENGFDFVVLIFTLCFNIQIAFAPSLNDLKKCINISVGISPIISLLNDASQTNQGLPPKSIATCARQSSIGNRNPYLSIPFLLPNAFRKDSPKQMATSSIVWCSSISRSP